jgi:hypothetical protein
MMTELLSGIRFSIRSYCLYRAFLLLYSTLITRGLIQKRIRKFESSDNFCRFGLFPMLMYINR